MKFIIYLETNISATPDKATDYATDYKNYILDFSEFVSDNASAKYL
jgi:hypothetical protein